MCADLLDMLVADDPGGERVQLSQKNTRIDAVFVEQSEKLLRSAVAIVEGVEVVALITRQKVVEPGRRIVVQGNVEMEVENRLPHAGTPE